MGTTSFYLFLSVPSFIVLVLLISIATQIGPVMARKRLDDRIFVGMLFVLFASIACDLIAIIMYALEVPWFMKVGTVSTTLVMILYIFFIYLWTLYIDYRLCRSRDRIRRLRIISAIPLFVVIILLAFNFFYGIVFLYTDNGLYEIRPFWYVYVLIQLVYMTGSAVVLRDYKKKNGGLHFFPVKAFIFPFIAGTLGELVLPGMSLTTAGASIGYLLIFIGMLRENTFEDPLTGFYNSFFLERLSKEASVGEYDYSSGILIFTGDFSEALADSGLAGTNQIIKECAMAFREDLPEGCETVYMGEGRFLIITKVKEDQEEAIKLLIEMLTSSLNEAAKDNLHFNGCFAYRNSGQDPGSLVSGLLEKADSML